MSWRGLGKFCYTQHARTGVRPGRTSWWWATLLAFFLEKVEERWRR